MSYPVAGLSPVLIPHGISVIVNAPAAFRFTAQANPERHLHAAGILGADISRAQPGDAGEILADRIVALMRDLRLPDGLSSLGYSNADIPSLVAGALPQHRLTKLSPRPASEEDLAELFARSLTCS
jgi:hydroxyacid-oxoacid transhydrogenase